VVPVHHPCGARARGARAGIIARVESLLGPLLPLFERERAAGNPVALGILVETAGSTYRKAGALMLVASNGEWAGLLSGGCLEGDLSEHARGVIQSGQPRVVTYDLREGDDLIWGLGLGCEGAMHILLMSVGPHNDWQPLHYLSNCLVRKQQTAIGVVVKSEAGDIGRVIYPKDAAAGAEGGPDDLPGLQHVLAETRRLGRAAWYECDSPHRKVFTLGLALPPAVLLLGAGPDAAPVVDFAARLGWEVTVVDHRSAYADRAHFPSADQVLHLSPEDLLSVVDASRFCAAVVMSHHLPSDLKYLQAISRSPIPYIGLLGPAIRREKLMSDLGADAERIRQRLHAPVGLALGGRAPESIALAIVAEIHAFVHAEEVRRQGAEMTRQTVAVA
jgi:xanthine dehydrogenase accessory factor